MRVTPSYADTAAAMPPLTMILRRRFDAFMPAEMLIASQHGFCHELIMRR